MLAGSTLPVSLLAVAQVLRCCFTAPSFEVFTHLLAGMVTTRGPRTVTGMLTGAGLSRSWSHHRAHRFFSRAAWDPRAVGLVLAGAVIEALVPAVVDVRVVVDDTLLRRRGKKVWLALWTHDGSARSQDKIGYGNTWVIAAVLVDLPFASRPVALPVLARLWRGRGAASRSELALAMARDLKRVAGQRVVHVVADAAYHHPGVAALPAGITWTTRLAANTTLLGPPPARTGKRGRPRKRGAPLGTLTQIAANATWRAVTVQRYGQTADVRLSEQWVQWYGPWRDLPVRLILLRDTGKYYDLALITTDLTTPMEEIVSRYASRWSIEVVFSQMRQILGVGQARNRTARAVERTVPFGLTVYTLVIYWYARHGNPTADVAAHRATSPWYRGKTEVSFQDMTDTLRRVIIAARYTPTSPHQATNEEILAVTTAWAQAA
jgi:DDE superfamily endonuclease